MSEQEKNEAIATTGEVTEKEAWYKRLWKNPVTKKVVKGVAAVGACIGSAVIGFKAGVKHGGQTVPDACMEDVPEETDGE